LIRVGLWITDRSVSGQIPELANRPGREERPLHEAVRFELSKPSGIPDIFSELN
jgi:hypothetical protein